MTGNQLKNSARALGEVVRLQAWHEEFSPQKRTVDLFADVTFHDGRCGGEEGSKVRFKLRIKQAEFQIVPLATEPVKVVDGSVDRKIQQATGKRVTTANDTASAAAKAAAGVNSSSTSLPDAKAALDVSGSASTKMATKTTITEQVCQIEVLHSADGDMQTWRFSPGAGADALLGKAWPDPAKSPRLKLQDTRGKGANSLPPVVKLVIRCRREDLLISDIALVPDGGNALANAVGQIFKPNNLLAAEAYIRNRLAEARLSHGNFANPYATITLADIFSSERD